MAESPAFLAPQPAEEFPRFQDFHAPCRTAYRDRREITIKCEQDARSSRNRGGENRRILLVNHTEKLPHDDGRGFSDALRSHGLQKIVIPHHGLRTKLLPNIALRFQEDPARDERPQDAALAQIENRGGSTLRPARRGHENARVKEDALRLQRRREGRALAHARRSSEISSRRNMSLSADSV